MVGWGGYLQIVSFGGAPVMGFARDLAHAMAVRVDQVDVRLVAATLRAADVSLKRAEVKLTHLQLAKGIGGKGWFTLAGKQHDVEAALEGAAAAIGAGLLVATELIQRPHADVRRDVLGGRR